MIRARRALALVLVAPTLAVAAQPAVETAVELHGPERATVRTRIPAGSRLAGESGFHGLTGDPERGWSRTAFRFERGPGGGLVFTSEVEAGADGWLRAPIPIPDNAPPPGTDLSFAAAINPPPGYRVTDAFPAGAATESGAVRLALPAPPSLLRFRVVAADAGGIGLPALVDGAVALLLVVLAGFGVRRLLRPAAPGADDPA